MKKKQPKLRVLKSIPKGFPKDIRASPVEKTVACKAIKVTKKPAEGVFRANKGTQRDSRLPAQGNNYNPQI